MRHYKKIYLFSVDENTLLGSMFLKIVEIIVSGLTRLAEYA